MRISLPINGREVSFSEEELILLVEEHAKGPAIKKPKGPQGPQEGVPFEVIPKDIDQGLFKEPRIDSEQEDVRKAIQASFIEMAKNAGKYWQPFKTLIIERNWLRISCNEFEPIAKEVLVEGASEMADWVQQALEWAQRIQNGESWEDVCNKPDTSNWFRAVKGKEGDIYCVGGSRKSHKRMHWELSATSVWPMDEWYAEYAVPLVIIK